MRHLPPERDALLVCVAGFIRAATVSLVGVTLAIHLAGAEFSTTEIGILIGMGLAGSSVATVVVSLRGDRWGRRRVVVGLTLLSATGYWALAVFTKNGSALLPLAFFGMLNGMGRDRGAASALDQAILPATVSDSRRTWALAWYNVTLDGGHALGALAATAPTVLMRVIDVNTRGACGDVDVHRPVSRTDASHRGPDRRHVIPDAATGRSSQQAHNRAARAFVWSRQHRRGLLELGTAPPKPTLRCCSSRLAC